MKKGTYISRKGWYWSVGDKFWRGSGFQRTGIGIDSLILKGNAFLDVFVGTKKYLLDCQKAIEFINKYKSWENLKGVKVGYIPKELLEIQDEKQN